MNSRDNSKGFTNNLTSGLKALKYGSGAVIASPAKFTPVGALATAGAVIASVGADQAINYVANNADKIDDFANNVSNSVSDFFGGGDDSAGKGAFNTMKTLSTKAKSKFDGLSNNKKALTVGLGGSALNYAINGNHSEKSPAINPATPATNTYNKNPNTMPDITSPLNNYPIITNNPNPSNVNNNKHNNKNVSNLENLTLVGLC